MLHQSLVSNIYVGDDGKLHKVQGGADTVLPFSSDSSFYEKINLTVGVEVNKTYELKEGQIVIIYSAGINFDDANKTPALKDITNMRMFCNGYNSYWNGWLVVGVAMSAKTINCSFLHGLSPTNVEVYIS